MEQEPERDAEEAAPGPLSQAVAEGSTKKQSRTVAPRVQVVTVEPSHPSPCLQEAPAAPWGHWSPAAVTVVEAAPPAPDELLPALAMQAGGRTSSPSQVGPASLESASSSMLSLYGKEGETSDSEEAAATRCLQAAAGAGEDECPICTEPYDGQWRKQALLNCDHALCGTCLRAIMEAAGSSEFGRVRCPMCRQNTPMLEWEICKLQEELLLLHAQPVQGPAVSGTAAVPPPRPGVTGALEHHFQVRFHTSRMFGCLPCVRYPLCLIQALGRLERRCRCCYLLLLAALLGAEMLSLFLIFLPIVLLVLLFLILDK
ncbi:ring finger protein-like [Eudromia elegans]